MRPSSTVSALVCLFGAHSAAALSLAASAYKVQDLPGSKCTILLFGWSRASADMRANGFSPAAEAVGDYAFRLRSLNDQYPKLIGQSKIIGMCEQGSLNFENLEEPHKSQASRLSKTRLTAALSAGQGSAVAFVSDWPDHVSIDACVINPSYLVASTDAEAMLLRHIAEQATEKGCSSIRLRPTYQVDGDEFYARCGFFPSEEANGEGDRLLYYNPNAEVPAAEPDAEPQATEELTVQLDVAKLELGEAPASKATQAAAKAPEAAAPAGFEWGDTY